MIGKQALNKEPHQLALGEWTKYIDTWYARCPNGSLANLDAHDVVQEGDLLTVSPSILVGGGHREPWHGFLKRGIWEKC